MRPNEHGPFDIVLALGLLYHTPDPYRALANCAALSRERLVVEAYCIDELLPGGLASDPVMRFIPDATRFPGQGQPSADRSNFWGFSATCLQRMVEDVGFAVRRTNVRSERVLMDAWRLVSDPAVMRLNLGYGVRPRIPVGGNLDEPNAWDDVLSAHRLRGEINVLAGGGMTRRCAIGVSAFLVLVLGLADTLYAQANDWMEPFSPFRIAGNLYYVGTKGLANYLITTPQGHILINSDLEANVPLIRASVEKLGFKFSDVKILLISHAHWDHDAGSAMIKKMTGARYMVMDADVPVVESGGKTDFQYGNTPSSLYPPTKVDRVLHDGEEVTLGGSVLVAHLTPGHTKGCTTWTMKVSDAGHTYNAVIVGSPNVNPGYRLVNNPLYPQIAEDYARMFKVLKSLPCDLFLGAHGSYFDMESKYARMKEGGQNPLIDPGGYKTFVAQKEQEFRTELAKQKAAVSTSGRQE